MQRIAVSLIRHTKWVSAVIASVGVPGKGPHYTLAIPAGWCCYFLSTMIRQLDPPEDQMPASVKLYPEFAEGFHFHQLADSEADLPCHEGYCLKNSIIPAVRAV